MTEDSSPDLTTAEGQPALVPNEIDLAPNVIDLAPNVIDVVERFKVWFADELRKQAHGEVFEWSASLVQFPTGQQQVGPEGQPIDVFVSLIAVYVRTPGLVLNSSVMQSAQVQAYGHDEEGVRRLVCETVAQMREARRKQPEEIERAAAAGNGRPHGSGLILPG